MQTKVEKKVLIASLVGSSIEWFDYFLYGTVAALVFNTAFFHSDDPTVGLMLAYASFALSFFIRPLGGVIFSHIGDKIGRKKTLVLTLSLMGGATVLMGFLPTYEQIGVIAPILLIVLRLIQGIGLGGEWGGALYWQLNMHQRKNVDYSEVYHKWVSQLDYCSELWLCL